MHIGQGCEGYSGSLLDLLKHLGVSKRDPPVPMYVQVTIGENVFKSWLSVSSRAGN